MDKGDTEKPGGIRLGIHRAWPRIGHQQRNATSALLRRYEWMTNLSSTGNVRYDTLPEEEKVGGFCQKRMMQQLQEKQATTQIAAAIESLLFVSGRPLENAELRKLLDIDGEGLASGLQTLTHQLESQGRGIRLQRLGDQVQLVTAPENARYIAALLDLPMTARLTTAALETLSVISYRQPITRAQIEAIRGVNSDRVVASLIQLGLIAEIGRAQTIGRPALFATTPEFLQQFGLTSLEQLPRTDSEAPLTEIGRE